jgi:hypothetical protein
MSFEERMALYKRKYDTTNSGTDAVKPPGRKPTKQNRIQKKTAVAPAEPSASQNDEPSSAETTSVKKGVFSKILGLFKKS